MPKAIATIIDDGLDMAPDVAADDTVGNSVEAASRLTAMPLRQGTEFACPSSLPPAGNFSTAGPSSALTSADRPKPMFAYDECCFGAGYVSR